MGAENSYSVVVEWIYKDREGREIIPVLFDNYYNALEKCKELCQEHLTDFIKLHGKGTIMKVDQRSVPFEPYYEMWQIVNENGEDMEKEEYEEKFYYIARPIIVIHYLNVPNKPNNI